MPEDSPIRLHGRRIKKQHSYFKFTIRMYIKSFEKSIQI
jgi:hypothetical protein